MKSKHEQLYVAVQDLLIEIGITPEDLRGLATKDHQIKLYGKVITAQKLIDADLIVEEINWRKPGKLIVSDRNNEVSEIDVSGPHQENDSSVIAKNEDLSRQLKSFTNKINNLPVEDYPLTTFNKIKSSLAPGILWSCLQEEYPEVLSEQIKEYLFPTQ